MAYRLLTGTSPLRGLLKKMPKANFDKTGSIRRSSVFVEPPVPWLEKPSCVFSGPALKHHWGALPIVIITAIGLSLESLVILRLAVTRDDVYWTKNSGASDYIETRPGYKVPIRKLVVFNQKYENPPGLIEALQGDVNGPPCDNVDKVEEVKKPGVNKKILAAHAAAAIGTLCFMFAL